MCLLICFPGVFVGEQSRSAMEMQKALIRQAQNNLSYGAEGPLDSTQNVDQTEQQFVCQNPT